MKKAKLNIIIKYATYFILLVLLCRATTAHGLKPFGLGMFVALIYARQNILALAPMFIVATVISAPSFASVIVASVPSIIFVTAYFIHYKAGKSMNMLFANLYTLLSQIPYIIFALSEQSIFTIVLTIVITQIFAYSTIIIVYAILIRGLKYRLTIDELISGAILLSAVALGLYNCNWGNVNLYYAFLTFVLLLSSYMFSSYTPLILSAIIGLGASFFGGNITLIGNAVCMALAVIMFKNTGIYFSAAALIIMDIILGFYFNAYDSYNYVNIIVVAVGALAFLLLPKRFKQFATSTIGGNSDMQAGKTIINRNRLDVSNRLFSIANVFEDMQELLQDEVGVVPDTLNNKNRLAKDIALGYCTKCPDCDACFSSLGTDTSVILDEVIETAEAKGRATIIDMPPFLTSRCRRLNGLIQAINDRIDNYKSYEKLSKSLDNGKMMLSTQMGGMAGILDNLGHDIKKCVSFDTSREKQIIDELIYHNIVCKEAIVYGENGDISVTLVVREEDASKAILAKIVSKVMRAKLVRVGVPDILSGNASINLIPSPKYDFVFGDASKKREGESVCGDTLSVQKIDEKKVILAVCDGMGSGENAEKYSARAVQMLENLYRAGFDNEVVLSLVNKLLALKNDENFSALAMCVLDLNCGGCDIIKLGAPFNFIKHRDNTELVAGHSLPIGIIAEARPSIERRVLFCGDMIVLMSDGITDVLTEAEAAEIISSFQGTSPQALADKILSAAVEREASDDATVLVARLYSKL